MSNSISLTIETQTENSEIISICHVNNDTLCFESSYVAEKMFYKNKKLFEKINPTTKIVGGSLYRQEITLARGSKNKLGVPILNHYDYNEIEIAKLSFLGGNLIKQHRAINKEGRKFDFDPTTVDEANTGGFFNDKKPSLDDIKESRIISTVEEIKLFSNDGIKTFMIKDNLQKKPSLLKVGYRVEFIIETSFLDHIKFVILQSEKSIKFLEKYIRALEYNYNSKTSSFSKDYYDQVMMELDISGTGPQDISKDSVKNSELGQVGVSFYNLSLCLSEGVAKEIYSRILNILLPTSKTSPAQVSNFLYKFKTVLQEVKDVYLSNSSQSKKDNRFSRVSEGKVYKTLIGNTSKEFLAVDQEVLGYTVFSDSQTGLQNFSLGDYSRRQQVEQQKYYPSMDIDDSSTFLTPLEQGKISDMSNAMAFLTPNKLLMGTTTIKTNRGMKNANINQYRQFRLAKSARAQLSMTTNYPVSMTRNTITMDNLSEFNVTIEEPKRAALERSSYQEIDPLIDSSHYVGDLSSFATNNPAFLLAQFKRKLTKDEQRALEIVSDIVPRRFLRNKKAIKSIKEIQFSNPKSVVRKLATSGELDFENIPPQIKFMMTKSFNPNPESDPLKNRESRQIIEETQKNVFEIVALTGFKKDEQGFLNIHDPIHERMSAAVMRSSEGVLAKARNYEVPELGITKDNFQPTIYNNLVHIRG